MSAHTLCEEAIPRARLRARLRTVSQVLGRADRRLLIFMLGLIAVDSVAGAAQSVALKVMLDSAVSRESGRALLAVIVGTIAAGVIGAANRIYANLQDWVSTVVGVEQDRETLSTTASMPGIGHLETPQYLDQVALLRQSGPELVRSAFAVTDLASLTLRIAIGVWLLASVDPWLVFVPLFAVPSVFLAPVAQRRIDAARERTAEDGRAAEHLHALFLQPSAAMELRVFDCASHFDSLADSLWRRVTGAQLRAATSAAAISSIGWAALAIGYVGALALVAVEATHGHATVGDVLLVSQLALQLRGNVFQSSSTIRQFASLMRLSDRFIWLREEVRRDADRYTGTTPVPSRLQRGITFEHVSFSYPHASELVLHDVSFGLPAGSVVAVVGENGAGKTTIVKLLLAMYRPSAGTIRLDGIDLADLDIEDWRRSVSGAFQDYLRIESVARRSVGAGEPDWMDDDERVLAALERADALDLTTRWPDGLQTHLGRSYEDGAELSGGQWQRVAIARAMMRSAPLLLILDEPTSALDPAAEHRVYERYAGAARAVRENGGIVFLISHRFSSVRMADHIVVLEDGHRVAVGTHESLIDEGGLYTRMYSRQAAAYQ